MSNAKTGKLSSGRRQSNDSDYVRDFNEAANEARYREADDWRAMEEEENLNRGGENRYYQIMIAVGLEPYEFKDVVERFPVVVIDKSDLAILRQYEKTGRFHSILEAIEKGYGVFDALWISPHTDGVPEKPREGSGSCFRAMCAQLGVEVTSGVRSARQLDRHQISKLEAVSDRKITMKWLAGCVASGWHHLELTPHLPSFEPTNLGCPGHGAGDLVVYSATIGDLLDGNKLWYYMNFYAGASGHGTGVGGLAHVFGQPDVGLEDDDDDENRSADRKGATGFGSLGRFADRKAAAATVGVGKAESVVAESILHGTSNSTGGVVRRNRRVIGAKSPGSFGRPTVQRNYTVSSSVMFNNIDELVQDSISPDFAQEIMEQLFDQWGLPTGEPEAMRYAEDLLFTFLIAVTASDKADYDREFSVPGKRGDVMVGFKVLSDLLTSGHGVTRRQFARGLADRLRAFSREEENAELRANMAARAGCQMQLGYLAFDGSTHCKGLSTSEVAFTRTLESRNLFESDDALASGSSERLLDGLAGRRAGGRV